MSVLQFFLFLKWCDYQNVCPSVLSLGKMVLISECLFSYGSHSIISLVLFHLFIYSEQLNVGLNYADESGQRPPVI